MYAQFALVIAATALLSAINAATLKPTQSALLSSGSKRSSDRYPIGRAKLRVLRRS
jgi:hypothetical protein